MKMSKTAIVVIAAGVAAAGMLAYLFSTEGGKKELKKWRKKREKALEKMDDLTKKAEQEFEGLSGILDGACADGKTKASPKQEVTI